MLRAAFRAHEPELEMDYLAANPAPGAIAVLEPRLRELTKHGWENLSKNPNALSLLALHTDRVHWTSLADNPNPGAWSFFVEHTYGLRIPLNNRQWMALSAFATPEAIALLRLYPKKIEWDALSKNTAPEAIALLAENPSKMDWYQFSTNIAPEAIAVWAQNLDRVWWNLVAEVPTAWAMAFLEQHLHTFSDPLEFESVLEGLCANPAPEAMSLVAQNWGAVKANLDDSGKMWPGLCGNPSAIPLIEPYLDLYYDNDEGWRELNRNPAAMDILEQHVDKVQVSELSNNPNPRAMTLLERRWCRDPHCLAECPYHTADKHLRFCEDDVNWGDLCENPSAILLLENNLDRVGWPNVSVNPAIFDEVDSVVLK